MGKVPEQFGEPDFEPDDVVLLVPDDEDYGDDGTERSSRLRDDEFLAGMVDRRPGVTLALTAGTERLRLAARRHPMVAGATAVCALAIGLSAAVVATRPKPSTFSASVTVGHYQILGTDQVISTLTVANPTSGALTLDTVAIGGPGGQNIGLGQSAVNVPIPAGGTGQVRIRGTLDCRADQPALPAQVQLTGRDARGKSRTVAAAMPGSGSFSASVDSYRRNICKVPYPLGITSIRYGGTMSTDAYPGYAVAMRLNVSVATVPGMDATPVRYTSVVSDVQGLRAMMISPGDDVTVAPGTPGTIDVVWVVDDCSRVPAYAGILALSVMGVDGRGSQMWDYALGDRFSADLMGGVRAACAGVGPGGSSGSSGS